MTAAERLLRYVAFDTQSDEASETCPSIVAADVPDLGEYTNVKAVEKSAALTRFNVSSKSLSVSVGKPTIMSVVI